MNTIHSSARYVVRRSLFTAMILAMAWSVRAQRVSWGIGGPKGTGTSETPSYSFSAVVDACPETEIFLFGSVPVLVSSDRGASWHRANFEGFVYAQDPQDPEVFYIGIDSGLARTDDGGRTFVSIQEGIPRRVLSVAVDPFDPRTIYAGVDANCDIGCLPPGGVYKSVDQGAHWTHLSLPDIDVTSLVVDPFQEGVVYADWFRSDDAGLTWQTLGSLPGGGSPIPFVVRSVPSLLYGVSYEFSGASTIFASTDRGRTWGRLGGPLPFVESLVSDPDDPKILIAGTLQSGIFRSTDGGVTWKPTDFDSGPIISMAFDPCDSTFVYASGADRQGHEFFVSRDAGEHFARVGVFLAQVSSVATDPNAPTSVYAVDRFGRVFRSNDSGQHWSDGNDLDVYELAVDSSSRVFGLAGDGVRFSDDRGKTWSFSAISPAGSPVFASSIGLGVPGQVFVGTNQGLWRSLDGGGQWENTLSSSVDHLASSAGDHPMVYASVSGTPVNPIVGSSDEGETWHSCGPMPIWSVSALAAAPSDGNVLYVSGAGEFGDTWLFRSSDGCRGFPTLDWKGPISSIAVSPIDPSRVYVTGTRDCGDVPCGTGVWASRDAGETWSVLMRSLPDCDVTSLASTPDDSILHAGSACGEVDIDLKQPTVIVPPAAGVPILRH